MAVVHRARAVIKYGDKNNYPVLIPLLMGIYTKMLANQGLYPSPPVTLSQYLDEVTALAGAQQRVKERDPLAPGIRATARRTALTSAGLLVMFVQSLADAATPDQAVLLIESAGLQVARVPYHVRPLMRLRLTGVSGEVVIKASAGQLSKSTRARTYGWSYTVDGGRTWIRWTSTPIAETTITGLPPLTECGFRVMVSDSRSVGGWSPVTSIFVH
jgi:hypothetical protein